VHGVVQVVQYLNLALYTVVALVALDQWRRHRAQASLWAVVTFATLALVVDAGPLLPEERTAFWEEAAVRLLIVGLVLFPYFLYRFAVSFRPPGRTLALVVGGLTAILVVWTFALPEIPGEGERWSTLYAAYVTVFTIHWTLLTIVVTWRLWSAGRGEPSVPRRRMRLLAAAAASITVALLVAVSTPDEGSIAELVSQLLATASAAAFLLGLAPPAMLRLAWRRPENERIQRAIAELMSATTSQDVVARVLPSMASVVGARAVELRDEHGAVVGAHGTPSPGSRRIDLDTPAGAVSAWTSPYAPFFGNDELAVLRTVAALTSVALDRSRLFAQERDARLALERADHMKTNFVALAAHELRTPVTTVHGLVETLYARRESLDPARTRELETALREQALRMKSLVEQLLDLSRLDADAVDIDPHWIHVRERLDEIVAAAASTSAGTIEVDVDPALEARLDVHAFDRIVSNLVVNALRYGAPPVTITAHQNDRHFRLSVEDRGHGVPPDFVPDLFERFSRSSAARHLSGGTGLGLAIAKSYAQAHGGDLLYSDAQPSGARFELVVPVGNMPRR
jgi:signal transduction histidine kinase